MSSVRYRSHTCGHKKTHGKKTRYPHSQGQGEWGFQLHGSVEPRKTASWAAGSMDRAISQSLGNPALKVPKHCFGNSERGFDKFSEKMAQSLFIQHRLLPTAASCLSSGDGEGGFVTGQSPLLIGAALSLGYCTV